MDAVARRLATTSVVSVRTTRVPMYVTSASEQLEPTACAADSRRLSEGLVVTRLGPNRFWAFIVAGYAGVSDHGKSIGTWTLRYSACEP